MADPSMLCWRTIHRPDGYGSEGITHRIHAYMVYMLTFGVYWWDPCYHIYIWSMLPYIDIYIAYMDPMGYWLRMSPKKTESQWPWGIDESPIGNIGNYILNRWMISKFPTPWSFKLTVSPQSVKMISKFPPPWNFNLTWSPHKLKMISKIPTPMELQTDFESPQG